MNRQRHAGASERRPLPLDRSSGVTVARTARERRRAALWVRRRDAPLTRCARIEHRLHVRYHREGDLNARARLVELYLPLADSLSRRYARGVEPLEDLTQVAYMALVKAVDRYEPDRGTAFTTFAVPTILGELRRYFRDATWSVRPPRQLQERAFRVNDAALELAAELGRSPSVSEVAERVGMEAEEVLEAWEARAAYTADSLDAPASEDEDLSSSLANSLGGDDENFRRIEDHWVLEPALASLPDREQSILQLRFGRDMTQSEIAKRVGISQMHVSRLLRRALSQLEAALAGERSPPCGEDRREAGQAEHSAT